MCRALSVAIAASEFATGVVLCPWACYIETPASGFEQRDAEPGGESGKLGGVHLLPPELKLRCSVLGHEATRGEDKGEEAAMGEEAWDGPASPVEVLEGLLGDVGWQSNAWGRLGGRLGGMRGEQGVDLDVMVDGAWRVSWGCACACVGQAREVE